MLISLLGSLSEARADNAPCGPNLTVGGTLPAPPAIDTALRPSFELDVIANDAQKLFCYVDAQNGKQYVEAPTIYARAGSSFTMKLVDTIAPRVGPNPPAAQAYSPDNCALLDYEQQPLPPASLPGYQGRKRVVAQMSAGDMLMNNTNFHTHGFHVEPDIDNVFKSLAQTANGVCSYAFSVRADQPPGTYWYHAHMHGLAGKQVGGGLAGTLVVRPVGTDAQMPETVVLIKDYNGPPEAQAHQFQRRMMLAQPPATRARGEAVPKAAAFDPFDPAADVSGVAFPSGPTPAACASAPALDKLGVNGIRIPSAVSDAALAHVTTIPVVHQSTRVLGMRYRVVNATSNSYLNVRMIDAAGAYVDLTVIGRDGVPVNWDPDQSRIDPAKPDAVMRKSVFISPSNRVDVFVRSGFTGTIIGAQAVAPYCLGYLSYTGLPSRGIVAIRPSALRGPSPGATTTSKSARAPRSSGTLATFADIFANGVWLGQQRAITFTEYDNGDFYVTQTGSRPDALPAPWEEHPFWLRPAVKPPVKSRYQADIWIKKQPSPQKTVEIWNLYNTAPEVHAFHIHQLTFVALKSDFEPATSQRVFLDSIGLPGATLAPQPPNAPAPKPGFPYLAPSLTQIKIDFTHIDKGTFVFHCHMLSHEDRGMMGVVHLY